MSTDLKSTASTDGSTIGSIQFKARDASSNDETYSIISGVISESNHTDEEGQIDFKNMVDGAAAATVMTIKGEKVGIGVTPGSTSKKFEVSGDAKVTGFALFQSPAAIVSDSDGQTISNDTWTAISFDTEELDNDAIWASSPNPTRLTCKTAGVYQITGHAAFDNDGTGIRGIGVRLNGSSYIVLNSSLPDSSKDAWVITTTLRELAVNDYIELYVYQNRGGNLDILSSDEASPYFMMVKVSDL